MTAPKSGDAFAVEQAMEINDWRFPDAT